MARKRMSVHVVGTTDQIGIHCMSGNGGNASDIKNRSPAGACARRIHMTTAIHSKTTLA